MQNSGRSQAGPGQSPTAPAVEHLSGAHELLKALQEKLGTHPELEEAIVKVEMALSILTVKTAGLL